MAQQQVQDATEAAQKDKEAAVSKSGQVHRRASREALQQVLTLPAFSTALDLACLLPGSSLLTSHRSSRFTFALLLCFTELSPGLPYNTLHKRLLLIASNDMILSTSCTHLLFVGARSLIIKFIGLANKLTTSTKVSSTAVLWHQAVAIACTG